MDNANLKPLDDCLFDAFTNKVYSDDCNPQNYPQMWAIIEGINRFDEGHTKFRPTQARQEHECVQGCEIEKNETYFKFLAGSHWTSDLVVCASCMAMILYFNRVGSLPPYEYSHWDINRNMPILIGKERRPRPETLIKW